jgi:cytoskeleton protein RodZ
MRDQGSNEVGEERVAALDTTQIGVRLRQAREAKSVSVETAAKDLRLEVRYLAALEAGDFERIPGPVFVRGYLRTYGRYLNVAPEPLVAAYDQQHLGEQPRLTRIGPKPGASPLGLRISWPALRSVALGVIGLVVIGGLVALVYQYVQRPASPTLETGAADSMASEALTLPLPRLETAPSAVLAPALVDAAPPLATTAEPPVTATEDFAPTPPPAVSTAQAAAQATLTLEFSRDSWVEVSDANERRLFNAVGKAGDKQTLTGTPPLSIVLGFAPGVRVAYNGQPVDLGAYSKGQVARFTLGDKPAKSRGASTR